MKKNLSNLQYMDGDFYFLHVERRDERGITGRSWHNHPFYEIMFSAEGESEYVIENRRYLLKGGEVLLIKPHLRHFEYNRIAEHSFLYCIGFYADRIANGDIAERIFEKGEHLVIGKSSSFSEIMNAVKSKLALTDRSAAKFIKSMVEGAIFTLDDYASSVEKNNNSLNNRVVREAIDYINANLYEIKTLDDIADRLFFSKNYVRGIFKKEMGIGIMEYVRNKKLVRAYERIKKGEKPTEIYLECGFTTYSGFYRAYSAYFGFSPKTKKY